jgi:hypothetical protein
VSSIHTIYCDESGFTGNNLLNQQQQFFAYSSVAIEAADARSLVEHIVDTHKLQGVELKFKNLQKSANGHRAISGILESLEGRCLIVGCNKRFALAAKFFEYIFEPVLAENSKLFYDNGFHRFIANFIYISFLVQDSAKSLLADFESFMRTKDHASFERLFNIQRRELLDELMQCIFDFARRYTEPILEEIQRLHRDDGVGKWTLDLTGTALFSMLTTWGERFPKLKVYCDASKPLEYVPEMLNVMVGRSTEYIEVEGTKKPITFNLVEKIQLCGSSESGIQLADIVAGTAYSVMTKSDDVRLQKDWINFVNAHSHPNCLFPDLETYLDPTNPSCWRNSVILVELGRRAKLGSDPIEGMPECYRFAEREFLTRNV